MDATFKIVFWNWQALIVLAILLSLPFTLASAFALRHWYHLLGDVLRLRPGEPVPTPSDEVILRSSIGLFLLPLIQSLTVTPLLMALAARTVAQAHLGRTVEVPAGLRRALELFPRVLWIIVLQFLVFLLGGVAFGLVAGVMVAAVPHSAVVTSFVVLGAIAGVVVAVVVNVRWSLSVPAGVIEGRSGTAALRRSWRLSNGSGWKLFGNMLVVGLLLGAAAALVTMVPKLGAELRGGAWWLPLGLVNAVVAGVSIPVTNTARTLLYIHCRVRGEGLAREQLGP